MKKQIKKGITKGFTLTELVIVIVIVAILAAVLIPAYTGYVQKAKQANDTELITSLNEALQRDEQGSDYKFRNVSEVLDSLEKILGTKQSSIKAQASGNTFVWNQDTNRFYILTKDDDNAKYTTTNDSVAPLPTGEANKTYKYWIIYSIDNDFVTVTSTEVTSDYSVYLASNLFTYEITTNTGLDLGDNSIITINYTNTTANNAQTVLIVTNSAKETLKINAPYDTVKHYGTAGTVDITAIANDCYEEYGTTNIAQIKSGKIKTEQGGLIKTVLLTATTASVQNVGGSDTIGNVYATSTEVINANNANTANVQISSENVNEDENLLETIEKEESPVTYYSSKADKNVKTETLKYASGTVAVITGITSKSDGGTGCVVLPEGTTLVNTKTVAQVRNGTVQKTVTAVIIPDGVTTIEDYSFQECTNLEYVYIPSSVTEIGIQAFEGCTKLTKITIDSKTIKLAQRTFAKCGIDSATASNSLPITINFAGTYEELNRCVYLNTSTQYETVLCSFNDTKTYVPFLGIKAGSQIICSDCTLTLKSASGYGPASYFWEKSE